MKAALLALASNPGQGTANIDGLERALLRIGDCDLAVVAEAFGQGFASLTDDPQHDLEVAWRADGPEIARVRSLARQHGIAICFGFFERDESLLHSSAIVVDSAGETLALYRRMSPGWRAAEADRSIYVDGTDPVCFHLAGRRITVGLCGDLWDLPERFAAVHADVVLWPVWTNYAPEHWAGGELDAYAAHVAGIAERVLLVNSLSDALPNAPEWAGPLHGGAALFSHGTVAASLPMGRAGALVVDA